MTWWSEFWWWVSNGQELPCHWLIYKLLGKSWNGYAVLQATKIRFVIIWLIWSYFQAFLLCKLYYSFKYSIRPATTRNRFIHNIYQLTLISGHVATSLQISDPDMYISTDGGYTWKLVRWISGQKLA